MTRTTFGILGCLLSLTLLVGGCATLDAFKSDLGFNKNTGEVSGSLKGAGPGGQYTENKGLNLSLGNNTATIVIVGLVILAAVGGYAAYNSVPHKALKDGKTKT